MPLVFPFWASCVIRGQDRRPRRPLRAQIWLIPLREERVLEDPRRPGGLPTTAAAIPDIGKTSGIRLKPAHIAAAANGTAAGGELRSPSGSRGTRADQGVCPGVCPTAG